MPIEKILKSDQNVLRICLYHLQPFQVLDATVANVPEPVVLGHPLRV